MAQRHKSEDLKIPFLKLQGCGNSFLILDESCIPQTLKVSDLVERWCSSAWGLGTDGLLLCGRVDDIDGHSVRTIKMFNPDGSSMGMCGNGIRCIVRFEVLVGQVQVNQSQENHWNRQHQAKSDLRHVVDEEGWLHYTVEGRAIRCRTNDEGLTVTVDMGSPSFLPDVIPLSSEKSIIDEEVNINLPDGKGALSLRMTALSMGNPHGVLLELPYKLIPDGLSSGLLEHLARKFGPILENDKLFPNRANIEFVEIESRKQIHVAVWERAAGFTLACGTGACAAVVAYVKSGKIDPDCTVILPGGAVNVLWDMESDKVYLTGQVGVIAEGLLVVC